MHKRAFVAIGAAQVLGVTSLEMGSPFLPALLESLGVHGTTALVAWTGWAQAVSFGLSLVLTPVWGRLGDVAGRQRMLVRAYLGLALSLLWLSMVTSPTQVLLARAVQGALAGLTPAAVALLTSEGPAGRRIALLSSCTIAGGLVGPLLGGTLLGHVRVGAVYGLGAGLSLAAGLLVMAFVPETHAHGSDAARRIPLTTTGMTLPLLGGWITAWRSMEDPLLALFVQNLCGPSASWTLWAGVAVAAARLTGMISAPWWGARADAGHGGEALRTCLLGAGLLTAAQALAVTPLALTLVRLVLGCFSGALTTMVYAGVAQHAPVERRGEAVAFAASGIRIGACLGNAMAGAVVAAIGMGGLFLVMGAGVLTAVPVAALILPSRSNRA